MKNAAKYAAQYFDPPAGSYDWVKKEKIEQAPVWCSVDLRDGNQALMIPMSLDEKLEFFKLLVDIGFKEIEVGFPAASETEYKFLRTLIEKDMIPDDVTIQVLTQSREHIIRKTFESLEGVPHAIVHLYNSTSLAQREQVFRKSKDEIKRIATEGAELLNKYVGNNRSHYRFEYSPESFTGTEPEYALEVCNEVLDIWQPTSDRKAVINLPVTVELSLPHVYANQVEFMSKNLKYRDSVQISLHPHNDRGCAVADTELGLLAGADRVEGTLFGNGERTGNVDLITVGLNMYTHGVDPKLDFSDMPHIAELYERVTRMHVSERSPYSGSLVFAAFSGSHQDAIAKGMKYRAKNKLHQWNVPCIGVPKRENPGGRCRICRWIRMMSAVNMRQTLSESIRSPEKAESAICWSRITVIFCLRRCVRASVIWSKMFRIKGIGNCCPMKSLIFLKSILSMWCSRCVWLISTLIMKKTSRSKPLLRFRIRTRRRRWWPKETAVSTRSAMP